MPGLATKVWEATKRKSFCLAEAVCSRGPYRAPEEPYSSIGGLITVTFLFFFWNCFKSYIVVAAAVVHLNSRIVFKMMLLLRLLLLLPRLSLLLLLFLLLWLLLSLLVIVLLLVLCVVRVHNAAGLIPGD